MVVEGRGKERGREWLRNGVVWKTIYWEGIIAWSVSTLNAVKNRVKTRFLDLTQDQNN